jgi:DNA-binding CsgD family transcriptional regulator
MLVRDTILSLLPFGVVVVTAGGEVVLSNPVGRELLRDGQTLAIKDGLLTASSKVYQKALTEAIAHACRKKERQSSGFSIARQGLPPISVSVVPLNRRNVTSNEGASRKVLVLLSDPAYQVPADPYLLAKMFDFTNGEALIALRVIEGEDVGQIARELHLSGHTVRNHLKSLYSKTNTHKHCELLQVLLRSPAALRFSPTPDGTIR